MYVQPLHRVSGGRKYTTVHILCTVNIKSKIFKYCTSIQDALQSKCLFEVSMFNTCTCIYAKGRAILGAPALRTGVGRL